ncbi:CBO0543 family protein [Litchfieldia alkalitelluris]|uniref:CBO0543 family protein n=1 Tax=Litchfieldia alkalitelluris TaxID=304268 RepID=UPI001F44B1BD|nr:CBO0543 family protein [Litchfieldia alkalitelluris]
MITKEHVLMTEEQGKRLNEILEEQEKVVSMWMDYWKDFSNVGTIPFWIIFLLLIIPLVVIYFKIDRTRIFQIGFYGFNIHTWFTYSDAIAMRTGFVYYPFQVIPIMPVNFALDASFVPVTFMLVYQWCINKNKNVFLYGVLTSALFSFFLKPLMAAWDLIHLDKGMNYFYLFLNYLLILTLAILITKLFIYLNHHPKVRKHL